MRDGPHKAFADRDGPAAVDVVVDETHAARLMISEAAVTTHINNRFVKPDLHSPADAVRYAQRAQRSRAEP